MRKRDYVLAILSIALFLYCIIHVSIKQNNKRIAINKCIDESNTADIEEFYGHKVTDYNHIVAYVQFRKYECEEKYD